VNAADIIAALDLPPGARVDQRVPKKLLVEHGAPTAADKRRINEGIEEVQWLAALKPATIGVPAFRDEVREYLEIAVLSAALRADAKAGRLAELIHRAVPYPVFLIAAQGESLALSLAHKRWSQGEAGATVLDGEVATAEIASAERDGFGQLFRESLALARQPRTHLYALYRGWMDAVLALLAARVTGAFATAESPEQAAARQEALRECARLDAEITRLRAAAAKEKQIARQVKLNLELKRAEQQRVAARQRL
jgi:Domain of unknown function (DUF4391)